MELCNSELISTRFIEIHSEILCIMALTNHYIIRCAIYHHCVHIAESFTQELRGYFAACDTNRGALDPDPAGYPVNLVDPAGSDIGSGTNWPDLHNYDIKHHSISGEFGGSGRI